MNDAVPLIYAAVARAGPLTWRGRLLALAVALVCLAGLCIAATLPPSPKGFGSHTRLGLAPCQMMQLTGLPCPTCGMTTSWAWLAHGNIPASFYVQPMGTVLAIMAGCCVWGGFYVAATGRPVHRLLRPVSGRYYFIVLLAFAIGAWGWKIFIHLNGMDGWRP